MADLTACLFLHGFITPAAPHHSLFFIISHTRKGMELLNLDSVKLIQTENLRLRWSQVPPHFTFAFHHPLMFSVLNVYPSVHVCPSAYACGYDERESVCVCECLYVCISVRLSHFVRSCSCVSRVDVPKWGHFLSVWCLRNNPTAQKLLQPSASTYLSLYLYCSGYAFLFDSCPLHAVW